MKPATLLGWTFLLAACTSAPPTAANADLDALLTRVDATGAEFRSDAGYQELLDRLVTTAAAQRRLPSALACLSARTDATARFFRGRVHYLLGDAARAGGDPAGALASFDEAARCFAASMHDNDAYRDSCEQWLALCLGSKGSLAFAAGDLDGAEASLLAAARSRPDCIGVDLGGGETVKRSLLRLGERTMRDFARTEALFRAAAEAAGDDVDLLNNAAIYARDRGAQLLRAGEAAAATALFERSYATYARAVQQDPHSVRLRNDCALVAIHHLQCDWERSRRLLEDAIADGEAMLNDARLAAEGEPADLDEAVGDCYENLALWHLEHDRDAAAAKAAAARSLLHRPGEQRGGARLHLEAAERMLTGK
jgi:tetratricopeptide (TPR) repeat protein